MAAREIVESFWQAMLANDWRRAASHLAEDCVIDWPCSGERIVGRNNFAEMQARYPTTTGRWTFEVHRLVVEGNVAVSEVTVSDGEQSARLVAFALLDDEHIAQQIEYWPMPYDPPPGREDLTRPVARIP
jgi:limonene-1,2-epoxide hydrolase